MFVVNEIRRTVLEVAGTARDKRCFMATHQEQLDKDDECGAFATLRCQEGRILLAEDDPAMREMLVEILRADGRDVVEVTSGEEMLQVLRERSVAEWPEEAFSTIVTDHRMPNGDGLDVVELLRRTGCSTPILLITAFADEPLRVRADQLDAMVMSKPFPLRAFRAAVSVLLSLPPSSLGRRGPWPS